MIRAFYAWLVVRVAGRREMQSNGPVNVEALQTVGIQRGHASMQLHPCMQLSCLTDQYYLTEINDIHNKTDPKDPPRCSNLLYVGLKLCQE